MTTTDPHKPTTATGVRLLWLGTSICVLAGALLLFEPFEKATDSATFAPPGDEPDLELEGALITQFRDTGALRYRLQSPNIRHFQSRTLTRLKSPDLEMHSEPNPPWKLTARRGTIRNATTSPGEMEEEVILEENVTMAQHYPDGREFQLLTPDITVYPDREYAETSRDVTITTHAGRTTAVGLKGDLDQGVVHLFSNAEQRVHTILLPDQFK